MHEGTKRFLVWLVVLALIVGLSAAACEPALNYWKLRTTPQWRTAEIAQGKIVAVVNATGTVKPAPRISLRPDGTVWLKLRLL